MEETTGHKDYKDSSIPWLGEIPSDWDIAKIKYSSYLKARIGWQNLRTDEFVESGPYCVTGTDFKNGRIDWTNCYHVSQSRYALDPKIQLESGDILITKDGTIGKIAYVDELPDYTTLNSGVFVVRPLKKSYSTRFMYWVLSSNVFGSFIDYIRNGSTIHHLYQYSFERFEFPIPPAEDQQRIATFLDQKTAEIDEAINKKQRLIELLQEQKSILINQAVTKGLNPNVPMRDSGVEWIGEVPTHWEVLRFKFVAEKIVDCLHATPKYSENGEFPAIRTADISPGIVHLSSARRIESGEYTRWIERLEPKPGDILYSREGERFGIAACVPEGAHLCISQRMMVFRIRPEYNPVFVMWLLNNKQVYAQACQDVMGATAPHVNISTIRNYFLALPAREEQDSLVAEIENSTKGFSSAIANAASEISLFREYRSCLIADVVTGKLDVREAAIRLPDELDKSELRGVGEETEAVKKPEN